MLGQYLSATDQLFGSRYTIVQLQVKQYNKNERFLYQMWQAYFILKYKNSPNTK